MANICKDHNDCIGDAILKAQIICRDQNLALTPLRSKVLQLVWEEEHSPIKAYDLLEKLQKEDPSAKPVTIYRTLDFLIKNNLIHKIESSNSYIGCSHPTSNHDCAFLICAKCNKIQECCSDKQTEDSIRHSIDIKGFYIEKVNLEIHGTCKECI